MLSKKGLLTGGIALAFSAVVATSQERWPDAAKMKNKDPKGIGRS